MSTSVLVTGGSGFIAGFCIRALIKAGHTVRATLRRASRETYVRRTLRLDETEQSQLSFVAADLLSDKGWAAACEGVRFVLHTASPVPAGPGQREADLVPPAREGTLRVLKAAKAAGASRVVITSSIAAIAHSGPARIYTETDWTDPDRASPYAKSKILAERAAWDFAKAEGLELAAIHPGVVFGPILGPDISPSILLLKALLTGRIPAAPGLGFPIIDVRDVADLHVLALSAPAAAGERFLCTADFMWLSEIAALLRAELGPAGRRAPRFVLPDALLRTAAFAIPALASIARDLGVRRDMPSTKAQTLLGWRPRPAREAVLDGARSLLEHGLA